MKNIIVAIWLILLTAWVGYHDFATGVNNDIRLANLEKRNQRDESIRTYINETVNTRLDNIEKFLDDNWGEK